MSETVSSRGPKGAEYETKTVVYSEDGPGRYTVMMTRFDPSGNEPLDDAGYRNGVYVMYALLGGGVRFASTDVYAFDREVTAPDDNFLSMMLSAAKSENGWQRIQDGKVYTPSGIEALFG